MAFQREVEVEDCKAACQQIQAFGNGLKEFARSLGLCYTKYDNQNATVSALRSQIVRNTQLYYELHFRASREFIDGLHEVMTSYLDFSSDEFAENIEEIAEEAASYRAQAQLVQDLHTYLYADAKDLVETASKAASKLNLDVEEHSNNARFQDAKFARHASRAKTGKVVAGGVTAICIATAVPSVGLSLVGLVAVAAAAMYSSHHQGKKEEASSRRFANLVEAQNANRAAEEIAGPMSQTVREFSMAICQATEFFSAVNSQLKSFSKQASEARTKSQQEQVFKKVKFHCMKMKRPAANLVKLCEDFQAVAPVIDTELKRICSKENDHTSYVQEWLEKHEEDLGLVPRGLGYYQNGRPKDNLEMVRQWCPFLGTKNKYTRI